MDFIKPFAENYSFAQDPAEAQKYIGMLDNFLDGMDKNNKNNSSLIKKIKKARKDFIERFKFLRITIAKYPVLKKLLDAGQQE